jgi:hypothetical protein
MGMMINLISEAKADVSHHKAKKTLKVKKNVSVGPVYKD